MLWLLGRVERHPEDARRLRQLREYASKWRSQASAWERAEKAERKRLGPAGIAQRDNTLVSERTLNYQRFLVSPQHRHCHVNH